MTTAQAPSELNWDPPGPDSWHIDAVHHPVASMKTTGWISLAAAVPAISVPSLEFQF